MKTHKEGNPHLNELFNEARQEKPLVGLDEVKNILPAGAPAGAAHGKAFHFGISHIIVVSGIVVSSGLAYVTMKTDKIASSDKPKTEQAIHPTAPAITETPKQETSQSIQSSPLKPSSFEKTNTLLASTDKKLISLPEDKHKKVALNEEYVPSQKITTTLTVKNNGKEYKIVIVGAEVLSVAVDGVIIPSQEYAQHQEAIDIAKQYAEARIKEEGDKRNLMDFMDKNLRADKILPNESQYLFELSATQLLIDGIAQDEKAFAHYSELYKVQTGKEVAQGDEYQYKMKRKQLVTKSLLGDVKIKDNQ